MDPPPHTKEPVMLVLCRKVEEKIIIDETITVTVLAINGDKVRLGIDAPRDKTVHRHEVWAAIQATKPAES